MTVDKLFNELSHSEGILNLLIMIGTLNTQQAQELEKSFGIEQGSSHSECIANIKNHIMGQLSDATQIQFQQLAKKELDRDYQIALAAYRELSSPANHSTIFDREELMKRFSILAEYTNAIYEFDKKSSKQIKTLEAQIQYQYSTQMMKFFRELRLSSGSLFSAHEQQLSTWVEGVRDILKDIDDYVRLIESIEQVEGCFYNGEITSIPEWDHSLVDINFRPSFVHLALEYYKTRAVHSYKSLENEDNIFFYKGSLLSFSDELKQFQSKLENPLQALQQLLANLELKKYQFSCFTDFDDFQETLAMIRDAVHEMNLNHSDDMIDEGYLNSIVDRLSDEHIYKRLAQSIATSLVKSINKNTRVRLANQSLEHLIKSIKSSNKLDDLLNDFLH